MPELPEVETIKRNLAANLGAKIIKIDINRQDIIRRQDYQLNKIINRDIDKIWRRGKYLIISSSSELNIVFHLGMSGRFYILDDKDEAKEPHIHVIIYLDNQKKLIYQDTRRFGGVWLIKDTASFFAKLGLEPLSSKFTPGYLYEISRGRRIAIKSLLLNQHLIAGIGNIYADEALFKAKIRPDKSAGLLTQEETVKLCLAIKNVLKNSIKERGTTFRDFRDGYNEIGNFQNSLQVYGKTNAKCPFCETRLTKKVIGGRSSHFCSNCQL
ncbi:MAG TPA: bifunctional DNA-formamidopyrimidine glycosylase/DNA-(apurinic or apyrimidinic site) lyase [Syntrophomonadaceae bacterium]|nr:bifunctional DNA-formamidopyrimidine glycosylase/DNA-(apurinic or apyrimidinic site) lyase [Syntrophomonadaceae bacterium]